MTTSFGAQDLAQLEDRGITLEEANFQLGLLRTPPQPFVLDRPCRLEDGILELSPDERNAAVLHFEQAAKAGRVSKFVPASGAATRMFQDLEKLAHEEGTLEPRDLGRRAAQGDDLALAWVRLSQDWQRFPWSSEWDGPLPGTDTVRDILHSLLHHPVSGLLSAPKGLVPFHTTEAGPRSAFEEHVQEGLAYLGDAQSRARFHFTVSADHRCAFEAKAVALSQALERVGVFTSIEFSQQSPATSTLALDHSGEPVRTLDGSLLLRPGGHGSLIGNLDRVQGDLVLIKTIDNIRPSNAWSEIVHWQSVLGGQALLLRDRVNELLAALREQPDQETILAADEFLSVTFGPSGQSLDTPAQLIEALDRPLRVCGVVENTGEPGGGPFWIRDREGKLSCQIVESSEVGPEEEQQEILRNSTHFNPVLLACCLRDEHEVNYDLSRFVDRQAVILTSKTYRGSTLRALEHPGLWNGAMSAWNTLFLEVPMSTFAPVKTLFDLLRPEHQ